MASATKPPSDRTGATFPSGSLVRALLVLALVSLALGLALAFVTFLTALGGALTILVGALVLAYAIAPLVGVLRRRVPSVAAVIVTYFILLGVVAGVFMLLVPPMVAQAQALFASLPQLATAAERAFASSELLARLPPAIHTYLDTLPGELARLIASYGPRLAQRGFDALVSVASVAISLIVVPVLAAYLIFDAGDLRRAVLGVVPRTHRPKAIALLADVNDALGAFVRGQIIDGVIVGLLIGTMLAANRVPYALFIGVLAACLNMVPYLSILTAVPAVLLALAHNGWQDALLVAVLFSIIQQVDGNVIEPFVMRVNVALSPSVLIVSIVVFTVLFGPVGTFVAVPVATILRVVKLHFAPAVTGEELDADRARARGLQRFR